MTLQQIESIQPDEKGMISLLLNGVERRFMKEKFISYLQRNNDAPGFEIPRVKTRKQRKPKQQTKKRMKGVKLPRRVIKTGQRGKCHSIPIIATLPDGTELPFPSSAQASRDLNIYKCGIHRVLHGKLPHVNMIKFKFKTAS